MANGSRQRGRPKGSGTQTGQNTQAPEVSTSVTPVTNSDLDAFLQRLLTQVVQVVEDTITRTLSQQQQQKSEDLFSNLIRIQKMDPPIFEDSTESGNILDWMTYMEKLFSRIICPEEQKVDLATHYLRNSAYEWWEACQPSDHKPSWDEFKRKMEMRYYPPSLCNEERMEIFKPRPEDETVDQAAKMFCRILRNNPTFFGDEKAKIEIFEMRLSGQITKYLSGHNCETLEKYVTLALGVEASLEAGYRDRSSKRLKMERSPPPCNSDYIVRCCFNCGGEDHVKSDCSFPLRSCHGCGRLGHMVAFCRDRRNQM